MKNKVTKMQKAFIVAPSKTKKFAKMHKKSGSGFTAKKMIAKAKKKFPYKKGYSPDPNKPILKQIGLLAY